MDTSEQYGPEDRSLSLEVHLVQAVWALCMSLQLQGARYRSPDPPPPANGHRDSKVSPMHTNTPCFSETQGSQCSSCQVRRRAERLEDPLNFNKQGTELFFFPPENQSVGRKSKQTRESDCTCLVWRSVNGWLGPDQQQRQRISA